MLATDYAKCYRIAPQQEGESDLSFRGRVAGQLRDMGHIVEAHEAQQDKLYDDNENVMDGIVGAMAQALYGGYGSTGESLVGDDIAVGAIVRHLEPEIDPLILLIAAMVR